MRRLCFLGLSACLLWLGACASGPRTERSEAAADVKPVEVEAVRLALEGEAAQAEIEFSAMAWFGDHLILVPQYPERFGDRVFALSRAEILAAIDAPGRGLVPVAVPFSDGGARDIPDFEGFEAIAFVGQDAYLSVETGPGHGFLFKGRMEEGLGGLTLEAGPRAPIAAQSKVDNMSYEALLVHDSMVTTFFESNGVGVNAAPAARRFDLGLEPVADLAMAAVEYRITDVTSADDAGRFWAINYWWPGDEALEPAVDPIALSHGKGQTHSATKVVERLVEFRCSPEGVELTGAAPIQLRLGAEPRNWEGVVRLEGRGFLMVTDKFPETILAFLPLDGG